MADLQYSRLLSLTDLLLDMMQLQSGMNASMSGESKAMLLTFEVTYSRDCQGIKLTVFAFLYRRSRLISTAAFSQLHSHAHNMYATL